MDKADKGRRGEVFAAEYYEDIGYRVIAKNYHSRYGEIDVIAENEREIVFCEVKSRKGTVGTPADAVNLKKQQKITLTAFRFLEENPAEKNLRFDVFEIWHRESGIYKYNLIENAFEAVDFSGRYDVF